MKTFRSYGRRISLVILLLVCAVLCSPVPAASADGGAPQLAYVAGAGQGVSVIDIAQRRVSKTFTLAGAPRMVMLSLDGHALYVTQPDLNRVTMIATATGQTLCTASLPGQPSLLALSLDTTVLYAAGQGDTSVRALNPATCAIERTFQTREPVYGLAVAASTAPDATPSTPNQLWVAGSTGLTIFSITGPLLGTVPITEGPRGISIPAGFTAYVTTNRGTVIAVDLNTRRVIRTLLSGGQFGSMDYDATTGEIYVPDEQHNLLDVLTPITVNTTIPPREPARALSLDASPRAVAITSDGQLGFVALANGQVTMLDIPARGTVTTIAVGGTPHFIITGLYPPTGTTSPAQPAPITPTSATSGNLLPYAFLAILAVLLLLATLWLLRHFSHRKKQA